MSSPLRDEDTTPLSPSQLAAIGRAQARIAPGAMTKVWDPDTKELVSVPSTEEKDYVEAGFKVGPDAMYEWDLHSPYGKGATASAALGIARGASGGLSEFLIPQSLRALREQVDESHSVAKIAGEMSGGLASLALGGGAGAALAAKAGAQYAKLGAAAGRVALGAAESGIALEIDSTENNTALTAERLLQGMGMGAAINLAGEGAGEALARVVPKFQKSVGKFLEWASKRDFLKKVGVEAPDAFAGALHDPGLPDNLVSKMGDEARAAFGGLRSEAPMSALPGEQAAYRPIPSRPPPLPRDIPFAQAELLETVPRGPTFDEPTAARLRDDAPMSEADSLEGWKQADREAAEASKMGQPELADDLRADRDFYSRNRGMSDAAMSEWAAGRESLLAPDAEIDAAFDRAGLNSGGETVSGGMTDLPPRMQPEELPDPVGFPARKARPPTLNQLGRGEKVGVPLDEPLPNRFQYEPADYSALDRKPAMMPADGSGWGVTDKYKVVNPTLAGLAGRGTAFGLMHAIPVVGPTMSATFAGTQAALYAAQRATAFALNREQAFNAILDRVMAPAAKLTGRVVRDLFETRSPYLSSGYLGGDTDAEYSAIRDGTVNATTDPSVLENYYQVRYGKMMAQNPELYGNMVTQAAKQYMYVASQIPKDPRDNPGILDEPYDPPRSDKVKVIQVFNAANNPYSVLAEPTAEGIEAVAEMYPETLALVQKMIIARLADPKTAGKLTPEMTRKLSTILQVPVMGRDSPEFLGLLQQLAQMNGADPTPPQQGGPGQAPNLGQQGGKQFAAAVAAPSQQQNLDSLT